MGLFLCDLCNKPLSLDGHTCQPEDILGRIQELEKWAWEAKHLVRRVQDEVLKVLHTLPSLEGENVSVSTESLRALWRAAECRWFDAGDSAEGFLVRWIALHRILVAAFALFRSSRPQSRLEKLKHLRETCDHAMNVMGYGSHPFDVNPEDV